MKIHSLLSAPFRSRPLLALAVLFAGGIPLRAQTAVSNLGQSAAASVGAIGTVGGGETWRRAFSFTTGSSATSYDFNGITFAFNAAQGSPGALSMDLYSAFDAGTVAGGSGLLASLTLSGGSPLAAGNSVFTGSATLQPATTYFLQLSSASAPAGNNYNFPIASTFAEDAGGLTGWTIGDGEWLSNGSNPWTFDGSPGQFSVQAQASAIPEPGTYAALAGAAMLGFAAWRRRCGARVSSLS